MKTAQPTSLPPGVSGSGGMSRSTSASMAWASSAVKNRHGPVPAAPGGSAEPGLHGSEPLTISAFATSEPANKAAAVEVRSSRRFGWDTGNLHVLNPGKRPSPKIMLKKGDPSLQTEPGRVCGPGGCDANSSGQSS